MKPILATIRLIISELKADNIKVLNIKTFLFTKFTLETTIPKGMKINPKDCEVLFNANNKSEE